MEFANVGKRCAAPLCRQQDFLPFTCDCCHAAFCLEHRSYASHACPKAGVKDSRAISCPICLKTIGFSGGEDIHDAFDRHCMTECEPRARQVRSTVKRCPVKGCRERLTALNSYSCNKCRLEVCLAHRYEDDHACTRAPPRSSLLSRLGLGGGSGGGGGNSAASAGGAGATHVPSPTSTRPSAAPAVPAFAGSASSTSVALKSSSGSRGPGAAFAPAVPRSPAAVAATSLHASSAGTTGVAAAAPAAAAAVKPYTPAFGLGLPPASLTGGHGINTGASTAAAAFGSGSSTPVSTGSATPLTVGSSVAPAATRPAGVVTSQSSSSAATAPRNPAGGPAAALPVAAKPPVAGQQREGGMLRATAAIRARNHPSHSQPAVLAPASAGHREVCPTCGEAFADDGALIEHLERAHSLSASEACPHCRARFRDVVDLVAHVEAAHGQSGAPHMVAAGGPGEASGCSVM